MNLNEVCMYSFTQEKRALQHTTLCMCAYVFLCVCVPLQRGVTLSGCAGVTCPLRSSTGVHIEDGTRHTAESVCERC